jgi:hypothetical protein
MARRAEDTSVQDDRCESGGRLKQFVPDLALALVAWPMLWAIDRSVGRTESAQPTAQRKG